MHKAAALSAVAALAGLVLSAVPAAGGPESRPDATAVQETAPAPEGDRYVAFGDSFVSGPGIQPQRSGACARSEINFPSLVADELGITDEFTDASCGGATTEDLFDDQTTAGGQVVNARQLDAIDEDTSLITFGTLGGNDMKLVGLAQNCVFDVCGPGVGGDADALAGIQDAKVNMVRGIEQAKGSSPDATIFVIGYGTYLPVGGCVGLPGVTAAEADYLQGMIDNLSDMLAEVATQEGVEFVDMRTIPGIADHTPCAAPEKQWIRALQTYGDGAIFHPSACGMDAYAQHVLNAIRVHRGEVAAPFDDACVSAGPAPTEPTEPEGPSDTERKAALKKALKSTSLTATCRAGNLKARVKGSKKQVVRVEFRLGKRRIGVDKSAPYKLNKLAKKLAKHKGKVKAAVRVRDRELRLERVLKAKRPACLRR